MTGSGVGYAAVPPLVQYMIDQHGWHSGYYMLGGIILFLAIPVILLLFRNHPQDMGLHADGRASPGPDLQTVRRVETGLTRSEAFAGRTFWLLILIFSLLAFCVYGCFFHIPPMLVDRGMEKLNAAYAASLVGMTLLVVRVPIGFLIDRYFAPRIAFGCMLLSALGLGLFAGGATGMSAYAAAILVGFSIGAEIDLLAFMAGRYFGLANYGEIYGFLFASMMAGVSLGPYTYARCYDLLGNYVPVLYFCCLLILLIALLTFLLPRYPVPDDTQD